MKKKFICLLVGIISIIGVSSTVSAQDDAYALLSYVLGDTEVNISDFVDDEYMVSISEQIQNKGYNPAPDEYFTGQLIITNDKPYAVSIEGLETYGKVTKNDNSDYLINDYLGVLDEFLFYSFAIDAQGIKIADTPINKFTGATATIQGDSLVSQGGFVNLNSISLAPGESITVYYDFSFSWESDSGRTSNMPMDLQFNVVINQPKMYGITTEVSNGVISESVSDVLEGENTTINYAPNEGYELDKVIVDGVEQDIQAYPNTYTFSDIQSNHTIQVLYKEIQSTDTNIEKPDDPTPTDEIGKKPSLAPETGESVAVAQSSKTPATGDESSRAMLVLSFMIAGSIIVIQLKKRFSK